LQEEVKEKQRKRTNAAGGLVQISAGYMTNRNECIVAISASSACTVLLFNNVSVERVNIFKTYRLDKNNSGSMKKSSFYIKFYIKRKV
jgi:hypothetical protein